MGNSFIFIFAGFETSANMLNFTLVHLAVNLAAQAHLQSDIDSIVGDRPATEWTYAVDMGKLYNSMVGAVLNESLRVTPPVVRLTKINRRGPETLNVNGRTITIPHNSLTNIDVVGTGLNKNYWPHRPSKISNKDHDLEDFVPERWLVANSAKTSTNQDPFDGLDNVSFEQQGSLFRPAKGISMNFSEGARACPGRRFAQVEITAALSVIFKFYSVELDVSTWASDEEVARMSPIRRKELYGKAIARARKLVRGAIPIIALKIEGEQVQLRFVRRGRERFKDLGL
jgi:cytochrome P450